MQALTSPSMRRTMSRRAWYWEDTMPMKIWPLRACMQSSFSSTSPIPSSGGSRRRARPGHPGAGGFQEAARGHTRGRHAQINEHTGPRGPHTHVQPRQKRSRQTRGRTGMVGERQGKVLISQVTIPGPGPGGGPHPQPWLQFTGSWVTRPRKAVCLTEWGGVHGALNPSVVAVFVTRSFV